MSDRELPERPNLEQYKKQAKDLVREHGANASEALARIGRHHPRFYKLPESETQGQRFTVTDAQFVIAREHGFESWPKFSKHIEMLRVIRSIASLEDPVAAFLEVACVPRHADHGSGTIDHADMILGRYPRVARSNVYTAAVLGDEATVRDLLSNDVKNATSKGGPYNWDALTYLCFSRYLRLNQKQAEAFVNTARVLLEAGASAQTGWFETIDQPRPRQVWESAIYGAAGIARHAGLTRLLLEFGADPNDEETPYHVPEGYDNAVTRILLESGRLTRESLSMMLVRKADWHDLEGLRLVLEFGGDPNLVLKFGGNALQHALRRDNSLSAIESLLDHGADPALTNHRDGKSATSMAAQRGRGDVLALLEQRGFELALQGVDQLIALCAKADGEEAKQLGAREPALARELIERGGTLLAEFAGTGNVEGLRCLLGLGVPVDALYKTGDPYFDIAKDSTALHVAAWRAWPLAVKELVARGAPVNALDAKGRTALALKVKACVDSYWADRRTPESIEDLLRAGATVKGIEIPSGYEAADQLLRLYTGGS